MSDEREAGRLPHGGPARLTDLVQVAADAIVSRTLRKSPAGTLTVFAFDAGQELSEHTAPFDAYLLVLAGSAELTIGGRSLRASAGEMVLMPADVPHAVRAPEPMKMLLVMMRDPSRAGSTG